MRQKLKQKIRRYAVVWVATRVPSDPSHSFKMDCRICRFLTCSDRHDRNQAQSTWWLNNSARASDCSWRLEHLVSLLWVICHRRDKSHSSSSLSPTIKHPLSDFLHEHPCPKCAEALTEWAEHNRWTGPIEESLRHNRSPVKNVTVGQHTHNLVFDHLKTVHSSYNQFTSLIHHIYPVKFSRYSLELRSFVSLRFTPNGTSYWDCVPLWTLFDVNIPCKGRSSARPHMAAKIPSI